MLLTGPFREECQSSNITRRSHLVTHVSIIFHFCHTIRCIEMRVDISNVATGQFLVKWNIRPEALLMTVDACYPPSSICSLLLCMKILQYVIGWFNWLLLLVVYFYKPQLVPNHNHTIRSLGPLANLWCYTRDALSSHCRGLLFQYISTVSSHSIDSHSIWHLPWTMILFLNRCSTIHRHRSIWIRFCSCCYTSHASILCHSLYSV